MKQRSFFQAYFFIVACLLASTVTYAQDETNHKIVAYTVQKPDKVKRGEAFQVNVLFSVAAEWYIYAPTGTNAAQGMIETKVIFTSLPQGITRAGRIKLPEAQYKNGHEVYEGDKITMSQPLQAAATLKPGTYEIKGKVTYQTCNSTICLPPVTEDIVAVVNVK